MLDKKVRNKGTIPTFDANVAIMSNAECFLSFITLQTQLFTV